MGSDSAARSAAGTLFQGACPAGSARPGERPAVRCWDGSLCSKTGASWRLQTRGPAGTTVQTRTWEPPATKTCESNAVVLPLQGYTALYRRGAKHVNV